MRPKTNPPAPVQPATPAAYVAAQEWWNLMTADDFETVRFVDGEPEYSGSPLDTVFTSHFILYPGCLEDELPF